MSVFATNAMTKLPLNTANAGAALLDWLTMVEGLQFKPSGDETTSRSLVSLFATNAMIKLSLNLANAGAALFDWSSSLVLALQFTPSVAKDRSRSLVSLFATKHKICAPAGSLGSPAGGSALMVTSNGPMVTEV